MTNPAQSVSLHRTVIVGFSDPIKNRWCELAVPDGGRCFPNEGEPKIGVDHPDCDHRADLSVELDAFYCPKCGWNGRISGAWAVDVIESCRSAIPLSTLLADRNLDAMLSVMAARSGGDMRNVERSDLRAAIIEVLGWEGIHA